MKKGLEMATVDRRAFAFCRYIIALLFWSSVIFRMPIFVVVAAIIMAISAITGVGKAPLICLYGLLFGHKSDSKKEVMNVQSIRFAHIVGTVFSLTAILFFYVFKISIVGWIITWMLVFMQTIAARGYCSAQKLYECVILGNNCCNLGKKIRGGKCNVR